MKKRVISAVVCYLFIMSSLCLKLYSVGAPQSEYAEIQMSTRSVTLSNSRAMIYDRYLNKLTYNDKTYLLCIRPTPAAALKIKNIIKDENILRKISDGELAVFSSDKALNLESDEDILNLSLYKRYSGNFLCHIIGYLSESGTGLYGIEKEYDEYFKKYPGQLDAVYHTDALGRVLLSEPVEIRDGNYLNKNGIVLTIDKNIQHITENALIRHNFEAGAAVVLSVNSGEILACVSMPFINRDNITKSLQNEGSPFINRAFSAFSVGSVFKPVIAAAALENNVEINNYTCTGSVVKSLNKFNCNKKDGHGKMNIKTATALSCNTFFIELGIKTGAQKLLKTAKKLGFGKSVNLCNTLCTDSGRLPEPEELNSEAAVANFSFGQGVLLASPLQIAACYAVLASGGYYCEPSLVKGFCDENGNFDNKDIKKSRRIKVLENSTCKNIKDYLRECVESGTGKNAHSKYFQCCGKTATAQSGWLDDNGKEILHSWFVGFFPYENPEYVICIMKENGTSGSSDDAPIFKEIAEAIYLSKK